MFFKVLIGLGGGSMMNFDYHWFYSTLAQSIAAIIGIMGAFLVSRLLNLESDVLICNNRMNDVLLEIQMLINELRAIIKFDPNDRSYVNNFRHHLSINENWKNDKSTYLREIYLFVSDDEIAESRIYIKECLENKVRIPDSSIDFLLDRIRIFITKIPIIIDLLHKNKNEQSNFHRLKNLKNSIWWVWIFIIILFLAGVVMPLVYLFLSDAKITTLVFNFWLILLFLISLLFIGGSLTLIIASSKKTKELNSLFNELNKFRTLRDFHEAMGNFEDNILYLYTKQGDFNINPEVMRLINVYYPALAEFNRDKLKIKQ